LANNEALSIKFYAVYFTAQNMSFRSPRYPANKARAAADHCDLKPEYMEEFGYAGSTATERVSLVRKTRGYDVL